MMLLTCSVLVPPEPPVRTVPTFRLLVGVVCGGHCVWVTVVPTFSVLVGSWTSVVVVVEPLMAVPFWSSLVESTAGVNVAYVCVPDSAVPDLIELVGSTVGARFGPVTVVPGLSVDVGSSTAKNVVVEPLTAVPAWGSLVAS